MITCGAGIRPVNFSALPNRSEAHEDAQAVFDLPKGVLGYAAAQTFEPFPGDRGRPRVRCHPAMAHWRSFFHEPVCQRLLPNLPLPEQFVPGFWIASQSGKIGVGIAQEFLPAVALDGSIWSTRRHADMYAKRITVTTERESFRDREGA